jgi:hypothetical protein
MTVIAFIRFGGMWGLLAVSSIAFVSCSKSPRIPSASGGQSKRELLAVWRAPDTPIEKRLSAARSLLTTNMHIDEVEALLGKPTTRYRHNPGRPAEAPASEHPRIHLWHEYCFTDGTVDVRFLQIMNVDRFDAEFQSVGLAGAVQVIPSLPTKLQGTNR